MAVNSQGVVRADGPGDGAYGRLDEDHVIGLGVGGGVTVQQGFTAGTTVFEARVLVIDAAGPVVSTRWGPSAGEHVFVGAHLRPLFPLLFFQRSDTERERLDLLIQSLSLELGAAISPLDHRVGATLSVGVGIEVPLVMPTRWAQGLWLHVAGRYLHDTMDGRSAPNANVGEWTAYATLLIALGIDSGLAGREPPRYRTR